jgi:hypothetical protein
MAVTTWSHPKLGKFVFDGIHWIKTASMPAFKVLSYDTGYSDARRSTGKHELAFKTHEEDEIPSPAAVALADKVLANQKELVDAAVTALWNDFTGEGPDSDMWWHGDLPRVAQAMGADKPPTSEKELRKLLRFSRLTIHKSTFHYKRPIAELRFHAPFEEEHGVSLLTNGKAILGIGYHSDVSLFAPAKKRTKKPKKAGRK